MRININVLPLAHVQKQKLDLQHWQQRQQQQHHRPFYALTMIVYFFTKVIT
jgi:hypothetical protein